MIQSPTITLRINPQKFNLDRFGFTLVVTPEEIADALLCLRPHQLRSILRLINAETTPTRKRSPS